MSLLLALLLAIPLPPPDETWLKLDAGNYHVVSNASAADTKRLVRELTTMAQSPLPATVIIYRNAASFARVRDAVFQTLAARASGVYFGSANENFIIIQADAGLDPIQAMLTRFLGRGKKVDVTDPVPADRAEVLTSIGHLLARARPETREDAEAYLSESLRLNPKQSVALVDMHSYDSVGDDAGALTLYATDILEKLRETRSKDDVMKARGLFERAVKLNPSLPRALAGLGATYVVSEDDPAPGIAALENSLALLPGQEDAAINLITLYVRTGRQDDAQKLFDSAIARSSNPDSVRMGREALTRPQRLAEEKLTQEMQLAMIEDAMAKATAGKYTEALKIIDEVLPQVKDEEFRGSVERMRADIVQKVKSFGKP
jgi:hypothetical protein